MRASASSRTSPAANLYASQAKANTNKADQASPFALLLEAPAPSQNAKPSKKDAQDKNAQDSGDRPDNKPVPTQNDMANGTADQAAPAARPAFAAKTEKADRRQDNSTAKPSDDAADNSQAPNNQASGIDLQLADQQAAAAAQVPQPQPAVTPPADDDGDDLDSLAAADAANGPTRTDGNQAGNVQTPSPAGAGSPATQNNAAATGDANPVPDQTASAQNAPVQNAPAQKNDVVSDTQPAVAQNDVAADTKPATISQSGAMTRASAAMRSDKPEAAAGAQTYVAVQVTSTSKPAPSDTDSAAAPADPQPANADKLTIAPAAPSADTQPAASQITTAQASSQTSPKRDPAVTSVAALAQPATPPSDPAENAATQAVPQAPIKNDAKPAAPKDDAAPPSFAKTPGKTMAADPVKTDANTSDAAGDTAKAAPQPVQAANEIAGGAPQAPQPSFTPAIQHVQVTAQAAPNLPALAVEIAAKSQSGAKQFDIRLDPPELGRVDVRLSIDATGKASAHLSADQPQTLTLLQNDAPALTRALREAGLDVSQDGLNFSLRQQAENFNGNTGDDGRRGASRTFSLAATNEIDTAAVTAAYRGAASGRLDIRV